MPSTSKKQHGFMAAVANNPSFAKKVGVPQSVGKDFNEADKGRKFGTGLGAAINKQNTNHGKLDMPYAGLNSSAGKREGGSIMKGSARTRKFAGGGDAGEYGYGSEADLPKATAKAKTKGVTKAQLAASGLSLRDYMNRDKGLTRKETDAQYLQRIEARYKDDPSDANERPYRQILARADGATMATAKYKRNPSWANYTAAIDEFDPVPYNKGGTIMKYAKGGGMSMKDGKPAFMQKKMMGDGMAKFGKGGLTDDKYRQIRQKEIAEKAGARAAGIKNKEDAVSKRAYDNAVKMYENELRLDPKDTNPVGYSMRKFEDSVGDKMRSVGKFFGTNRMTSQDDESQMQARQDVKGYKKGGMPMKDGKPAFMKKFAKGGGIESRGKTQGTIIKMAAGGSVSSRADGIAQRGKTRR